MDPPVQKHKNKKRVSDTTNFVYTSRKPDVCMCQLETNRVAASIPNPFFPGGGVG